MKRKMVLLVEDNIQVMKNNTTALEMNGAVVLQATSLSQARALMDGTAPDAAVIDIMLPDGSGIDLLRTMRAGAWRDVPVLLLTAKGDPEDIISGLEMGADDYLPKPYDLNVFEARIVALLRRSSRLPSTLRCGGLCLDIASNTAHYNAENLHLTQKEFSLLLLLAQNLQHPMAAGVLYEKVWGKALLYDNTSALRIQMSNLKKKLAAVTEEVIIESSRGEGYCLTVM
ncbi:response regulator transcription factor [Eubacteriales bacterium OttesenSCG-928-N13]|nr:response regulator transcription factor [Eubacteriales bacterium OttesenSCG-928-N13]